MLGYVILLGVIALCVALILFWVRSHPVVKEQVDQDLADLEARTKAARDQATAATGGVRDWFRKVMGR